MQTLVLKTLKDIIIIIVIIIIIKKNFCKNGI